MKIQWCPVNKVLFFNHVIFQRQKQKMSVEDLKFLDRQMIYRPHDIRSI